MAFPIRHTQASRLAMKIKIIAINVAQHTQNENSYYF